ncbi:hypothetical protein FRC07_002568 [Ceratobasidium sp. 392]|nr:hypothetical protein FRC07_002568 [Ceratobasidium sp. 392]
MTQGYIQAWPVQDSDRLALAARESIKHELKILTQLKHPNICTLWGYEKGLLGTKDVPAIVTECGTNGTLQEYLTNNAAELNIPRKIKLMENILKAVEYLHDGVVQGTIVHGNIDARTQRTALLGVRPRLP